jgi:hypothetical protein
MSYYSRPSAIKVPARAYTLATMPVVQGSFRATYSDMLRVFGPATLVNAHLRDDVQFEWLVGADDDLFTIYNYGFLLGGGDSNVPVKWSVGSHAEASVVARFIERIVLEIDEPYVRALLEAPDSTYMDEDRLDSLCKIIAQGVFDENLEAIESLPRISERASNARIFTDSLQNHIVQRFLTEQIFERKAMWYALIHYTNAGLALEAEIAPLDKIKFYAIWMRSALRKFKKTNDINALSILKDFVAECEPDYQMNMVAQIEKCRIEVGAPHISLEMFVD